MVYPACDLLANRTPGFDLVSDYMDSTHPVPIDRNHSDRCTGPVQSCYIFPGKSIKRV